MITRAHASIAAAALLSGKLYRRVTQCISGIIGAVIGFACIAATRWSSHRAARSVSGVYGVRLWIVLMDMDVFSICCKVGRRARAADPTCPTSTYASGCIVRQYLSYLYLWPPRVNKQSPRSPRLQRGCNVWRADCLLAPACRCITVCSVTFPDIESTPNICFARSASTCALASGNEPD